MQSVSCDELLKPYRGYSPDFYYCVCDRLEKNENFDDAVAICEALYG